YVLVTRRYCCTLGEPCCGYGVQDRDEITAILPSVFSKRPTEAALLDPARERGAFRRSNRASLSPDEPIQGATTTLTRGKKITLSPGVLRRLPSSSVGGFVIRRRGALCRLSGPSRRVSGLGNININRHSLSVVRETRLREHSFVRFGDVSLRNGFLRSLLRDALTDLMVVQLLFMRWNAFSSFRSLKAHHLSHLATTTKICTRWRAPGGLIPALQNAQRNHLRPSYSCGVKPPRGKLCRAARNRWPNAGGVIHFTGLVCFRSVIVISTPYGANSDFHGHRPTVLEQPTPFSGVLMSVLACWTP
ncbi:hypothetical protein JTE90_007794, partial [Oedothorax gibbosus]